MGAALCPAKEGLGILLKQKPSSELVFLTEVANFMLLPGKFVLPEGDALLLLSPLTCKISPMHLSGSEIPAQALTRTLVTTIW